MDAKLAAIACRPSTEEEIPITSLQVSMRVEDAILSFLRSLAVSEAPKWLHKKPRTYKRVVFDISTGTNRAITEKAMSVSLSKSPKSFSMMLTIGLALQNLHMTKRDLYYAHASLFGAQRVSDSYLELLYVSLELPRLALPIQASERGLVAGDVTITTSQGARCGMGSANGLFIDGSFIQPSTVVTSPARFVLLIEKEAVFQRLLRDGFQKQWPCILVTGKGYPDLVTRVFLRRLRVRLGLPVLALCDWDPHGVEILATYKFGSCAMSNSTGLAVPGIRWLGVHAADLKEFAVPPTALLPLGERERARGVSLATRECLSLEPLWLNELRAMQHTGTKAEIEALSARGVQFLCEEYLPRKLREGKWHD